MTKKEVAIKYIEFLAKGEVQKVIKLFSKEAIVYSPIYGVKRAEEFFIELNEDTNNSDLILNGIFEEQHSNRLALYFKYKWTLKSDKLVEFEVVDILEFNESNEINELKIIYDSVRTRELVKQLKE